MFDFEASLKLLVTVGVGVMIFVLGGIGVRIMFRGLKRQTPENDDQLAVVDERLARLEGKLGELEERLDFTERMLTEVRGKAQIPGKS
jgi:hypothetical protein